MDVAAGGVLVGGMDVAAGGVLVGGMDVAAGGELVGGVGEVVGASVVELAGKTVLELAEDEGIACRDGVTPLPATVLPQAAMTAPARTVATVVVNGRVSGAGTV
jgi:hypothetical protein